MSQRTRLKKMSLGAALILGTVSVSNFAEAMENGSSTIPGTESETNKGSVNSGVDEKGNQSSDASRSEALPGSAGSPKMVEGNASVNSAGSSVAETVANTSNSSEGPSTAAIIMQRLKDFTNYIKMNLTEQFFAKRAEIQKEFQESRKTLDIKAAIKKLRDATSKIYKEYSAKLYEINKLYQEIKKNFQVQKNPEEQDEIINKFQESLGNVVNQKPLGKPSVTEGLNEGSNESEAKEINLSDSSKNLNESGNSSNKTVVEENEKALGIQAAKEEADVAKVANQEDLIRQAATEAANVAKQKELIKKAATEAANVAKQKELIKKAGKEAANVAKERGLRPSSLEAEMDAAIEDLRKGDTAKAKYFYEKSNEVIEKYYYGTDEQIAELKNMGYNRVNIEHLRNLNTEAGRAIAGLTAREENRKNEDKTEDDVEEYVGSEGMG